MSKTIDEILDDYDTHCTRTYRDEIADLMRDAQLAAFERAAALTARLGEYRSGKQVAAEIRNLKPE